MYVLNITDKNQEHPFQESMHIRWMIYFIPIYIINQQKNYSLTPPTLDYLTALITA